VAQIKLKLIKICSSSGAIAPNSWRLERSHFTVQCAVIGCKLKQNANEGCNSCASLAGLVLSFIACFILLVIASYMHTELFSRL